MSSFWGVFRAWFTSNSKHDTGKHFIKNPYAGGGIQEEDGHLKRKDIHVTYVELFTDLSLVAALTVFSKETQLSNGATIGSYIMYVAVIWSVFASQSFYASRWGARDGLGSVFNTISMLTFAYLAAVAGNFQAQYGISPHEAETEDLVPQLVSRVTMQEPDHPADIERAVRAVSGIFAASRGLLLVQYLIPLVFAYRARQPLRAIAFNMLGIAISAVCWFGALGTSFGHNKASAIARISLWTVGIAAEWFFTYLSVTMDGGPHFELEYFCERFNALTLIVLGEGIIGLFESFKVFLGGVAAGIADGPILTALLFSVGIFRCLYYLYFSHQSHHLRGGPKVHVLWALLHFPLHVALLLVTRSIAKSIQGVAMEVGLSRLTFEVTRLSELAGSTLPETPPPTIEQLTNAFTSDEMISIAGTLGLNYRGRIATVTSLSGDNVTNWLVLYGAELLSMTSFISNSYGFPPTTAFYDAMDRGLWDLADGVNGSGIDNVTITELYGRAILTLFEPVFGSCMYIFTDLGAFLITLAALTLLQRNIDTIWRKLSVYWRILLGVGLLAMTCLNIGPPPNIQELFGEVEGGYAYIYALIGEWWLVAVVFASLLTVNIVDVTLYFLKVYRKRKELRLPSAAASEDHTEVSEGREKLQHKTSDFAKSADIDENANIAYLPQSPR